MIRGKWGGGGGGGRSPKIFFKALWASPRSKNKGAPGPSSGSASGNEHFAPWKVIRISGPRNSLNFFFVESGIPLTIGIWNPKSKFHRWFFRCWRGFSPVFPSRKNPTLPSFNSISNSRPRLNEFLRTPKGLWQSRYFLINFSCFRFLMETKIVTPLCITS